ncbi:hypothetical protein ACKKBF_B33420 [Auxenochlorella protothecoides x Auxenochlorella symbiontica]
MSGEAWTTIESDPGVFTELIERLGVKGVQVEELYSLDADSLQAFEPIYGLIFLFKWQAEPVARSIYPEYEERGIFFAKQVINNACATQAILSILLNRPELDIGEELSQFRDFTAGFPADLRGEAIGNSETIRRVHNSFTAPHALLPENPDNDSEGEAFHFVAYTYRDGSIWELDGLQAGPICLGEAGQDEWTQTAASAMNKRIAQHASHEIKFNLLAVTKCRRTALQDALTDNWVRCAALEEAAPGSSPAAQELAACRHEGARLSAALDAECSRRAAWSDENLRRRTDYVPAVFNLLTALAACGELKGLVAAAAAAGGGGASGNGESSDT